MKSKHQEHNDLFFSPSPSFSGITCAPVAEETSSLVLSTRFCGTTALECESRAAWTRYDSRPSLLSPSLFPVAFSAFSYAQDIFFVSRPYLGAHEHIVTKVTENIFAIPHKRPYQRTDRDKEVRSQGRCYKKDVTH